MKLASGPEQLSPKSYQTIAHEGGRIVKRIVTMIMAVLLLSAGIVTAAERKTTQEPSVAAAGKTLPEKLDLNRVSLEQLVGVPGIGPHMAQAIVDLRTKNGSFKSVEDLLEVTGIKQRKLAAIAEYLKVIPLQTSAATTPATQSK